MHGFIPTRTARRTSATVRGVPTGYSSKSARTGRPTGFSLRIEVNARFTYDPAPIGLKGDPFGHCREMFEYEVQRCTRRCHGTDRELQAGEPFFSVLVPERAQVVRHDFSVQAWKGPPDNALGWWKSQMPDPSARKLHWAPNDVMLHYFEQLAQQPERNDIRYVLGLLMIRRRVLRLEESEHDESGGEVLVLYCPRNDKEYQVNVFHPGEKRISEIQAELAQLLFAKAA